MDAALYVQHKVWCNGIDSSWRLDERFKRDIQALDGTQVLDALCRLRPVTYCYVERAPGNDDPDVVRWGLVAQEVQQHFPHIVDIIKHIPSEQARPTSEVYGVKYLELIDPLLVSIQELCRQYAPLISAVKEIKLLQPRVDQVALADGLAFVDIRERWGDEYANCVANTSKYQCHITTQSETSWDVTKGVINGVGLRIMCQNPSCNDLVSYTIVCTDIDQA